MKIYPSIAINLKNLPSINPKDLKTSYLIESHSLSSCLEELQSTWHKNNNLAALWQDWSKIVGEPLASNSRPLHFSRGVLVIGTNHPQWRQAIFYTRNELITTIKKAGYKIKEIKIKQHYALNRKEKVTEESIWAVHPSRIEIHGMTTCKICNSPAPTGEINLWNKCIFCRRKDLG